MEMEIDEDFGISLESTNEEANYNPNGNANNVNFIRRMSVKT